MKNALSAVYTERSRHADKIFLYVLCGLLCLSFALSSWYDTWGLAIGVGIPAAVIPGLLIVMRPGAFITRAVVAVALMVFCALHIHQAQGLTEIHFGIFVLLAFLLAYQDWAVILIAAVTVAVHHLLFNYLQSAGYAVYCFTHPSFYHVVMHAAYVVVEAGVLIYLAYKMRANVAQAFVSHQMLTKTFDTMHTAVNDIQQHIQGIAAASEHIAKGSIDLSARTEKQTASLSVTSSTLSQFTDLVKNNAEHTKLANQLVLNTSQSASLGQNVVHQVVETMDIIHDSAQKVTNITEVIDGISVQTNLLALNAAVEAARAGEQGRGFAVVASEVRNLAQRSASAAQEIKILIGQSSDNIEKGSQLVRDAGKNMEDIVASVKQVVSIMRDIAHGSDEQSSGIERINEAVAKMEDITKENSVLVTKTSSISEDMHQKVEQVSQSMLGLVNIHQTSPTVLPSK